MKYCVDDAEEKKRYESWLVAILWEESKLANDAEKTEVTEYSVVPNVAGGRTGLPRSTPSWGILAGKRLAT
ncbi:MAG TPA: hypothetical protein VFA98_04630 [Thermoanaerobaculia bacterium]|jgi:hypothetical protein|nr:hypothetical protein [Thermoanaerobaculia bacterium]